MRDKKQRYAMRKKKKTQAMSMNEVKKPVDRDTDENDGLAR